MNGLSWELGSDWLGGVLRFWGSGWGIASLVSLLLAYLALRDWHVHRRRGWAHVLFRATRWLGRGLMLLLVGLFLEVSHDDLGNWDDE